MEAVSRGAKEAGGRTLGITAAFFASRPNPWLDQEIRVKTWRDRLFELVKRGRGYVVCRGGTGTLVELAVVWESFNKGVMHNRPLVALGDFWEPVVRRVNEVEDGGPTAQTPHQHPIRFAASPREAAECLAAHFCGSAPARPAARSKAGELGNEQAPGFGRGRR
jgi:predicted Rossmann-fold nucleotide-binding protein